MALKYETIRSELYRRLCDGVYPVGSRLPTDEELASAFSVNRHTVRHAVSFLADAGYIQRSPRTGTIVMSQPNGDSRTSLVRIQYRYLPWDNSVNCPRTLAAERIVERFTRQHPHIQVALSPLQYGDAFHLPTANHLGDGGQVIVSRFSYVADHARSGLLLPLEDFDDIVDVCAPLDGRLVYRTADASGAARIHALPAQSSSWMLAANRTLLRSVGLDLSDEVQTWAGFMSLCEAAASRGVKPISLELMGGPQFVTRFFPYFYGANGGRMLIDAKTGVPQLDAPGNERTLEFLRQLYAKGLCHLDPSIESFMAGQCAFRLAVNPPSIVSARARLPQAEIVPLPVPVPEAASPAYTVIRGEFVGIVASTVRNRGERQAAWEFVKFLLCPEAQEIAFRQAREMPPRSDLIPLVSGTEGLERQFFEYGLRHGLPTFDVPHNAEIHAILQRVMIRAMTGECRPEAALSEGQEVLRAYVVGPPPRNGKRLEHSLAS